MELFFEEKVDRYEPLIKYAAHKLKRRWKRDYVSFDELVQEGLLALWRVVKKYPDLEGEELDKTFRTSLKNAYFTLQRSLFKRDEHDEFYLVDLDAYYSLGTEDMDLRRCIFEASVKELIEMLTPLARETVELLYYPTDELMAIVKKDYRKKEKRYRVSSYKILKKHIAEAIGLADVHMGSIMEEIRLTIELNEVFA